MRRIPLVGALVGILAVVSGCWAFGVHTGPPPLPDPSTLVRRTPGPSLSPWPDPNTLIVQLEGTGPRAQWAARSEAATSIIRARLAGLGIDATVTPIPEDRLRIDVADGTPRGTVGRIVTSDADLEFMAVPGTPQSGPMDRVQLFGADGIATARPGTTPDGKPAIDIDLRPEAVQSFRDFVDAYPGWRLAIFLDGGPITAPPFEAAGFDGHAQIPVPVDIRGPEEMIAILIDGGTLPVEAGVMEECPAPDACPGAEESARPSPSAWATQSIVIVQLGDLGASVTADEAVASAAVVGARLAALGVAATVTVIPDGRLRIDIADASAADAVKRVATATGVLEFVGVPNAFSDAVIDGAPLPAGTSVPLFGGDSIVNIEVGEDVSGQPAIDVQLDAAAAQVFDTWASRHIGERFAIVLDGKVISAPVLRTAQFNGRAQISGGFDLQGTQELIAILHGGVLPVAAEVLNVCPATSGDCTGSSPDPSGQPVR